MITFFLLISLSFILLSFSLVSSLHLRGRLDCNVPNDDKDVDLDVVHAHRLLVDEYSAMNFSNVTNITTYVPTIYPTSPPSTVPTTSSRSSNNISDQDFAFGLLVVICAVGSALLMIAFLKIHIHIMLKNVAEEESDEENNDSVESDKVFPLQKLSKNSDNVKDSCPWDDDIMNDGVEEHGFDFKINTKLKSFRASGT